MCFYSKCICIWLCFTELFHRILPLWIMASYMMLVGICIRSNIEIWLIMINLLMAIHPSWATFSDIPSFSQALACWASKNLSIAWRKLLWKLWKLQHIVLRCRPRRFGGTPNERFMKPKPWQNLDKNVETRWYKNQQPHCIYTDCYSSFTMEF